MINKILKSEILYTVIFFSVYLTAFVNIETTIYFILGFLYVYLFIISSKFIKEFPFVISVFYIVPLIAGYYFQTTNGVIGTLIGTSIASFVFLNRSLGKMIEGNSKFTNIALVGQVTFSFFYFYNLVIQDIRGRNKLNSVEITLGVFAFIFATSILFPLLHKLISKKIDNLSFYW